MEKVLIKSFDQRTSKKGAIYYDGACKVDVAPGVKWFVCFDKNIVAAVPPGGGVIEADVAPTDRSDKIKISNVKLPAGAKVLNEYVDEAKKLDAELGLEKRIAELESRLKNLEMGFADHLLEKTTQRGAAQGTL